MSSKYTVLDESLIEHIVSLPEREQGDWLILEPHSEFRRRWFVDSLDPGFFFDFEDIVGRYRTVSVESLGSFTGRAQELDYQVAFTEDPQPIIDWYADLSTPPPFELNSDLEGTINGMLPFQVEGFNYLRDPNIRGGLALWSTGVGKTALMAALIKWHAMNNDYDLCIVCVKKHNKRDTQRKLNELGDLESLILDGSQERRDRLYADIWKQLDAGQPLNVILNYEKFRDDEGIMRALLDERRCLFFFDEMPAKLRNRGTLLYDAVGKSLYKSFPQTLWHRARPSWMRTYQLTATPIESSPENQLNCIRLQDPDVFPTVQAWRKEYVRTYNFFSRDPETFANLDKMGLKVEFMTHQVDKDDPEIAKLFPAVIEDSIIVDWHEQDRAVYETLQAIALDLIEASREDGEVEPLNPMALIGVLQMLCDAPSMVQRSAENREEFEAMMEEVGGEKLTHTGAEAALKLVRAIRKRLTDDTHSKLDMLRDLVVEKHPDQKILVYSVFADYIFPVLEPQFEKWGVTYVTYKGTEKQKDDAKQKFREDEDIRIFFSSDSGSDSIDLPEASVVIHYDLPWNWSTLIQRQNRAHRINSKHDHVWYYTLLMADSVEDRKVRIISKKLGYHRSVFKGEIAENIKVKLTPDEYWYILTGELPSAN